MDLGVVLFVYLPCWLFLMTCTCLMEVIPWTWCIFTFRRHLTKWTMAFFSTNRSHFERIAGGVSADSPVLSCVPQGTVLGPLLFLIMIANIIKDVSKSNLISFADDTQSYAKIHDVSDCNLLQQDLSHIYDWDSTNNMCLMPKSFIILPSVLRTPPVYQTVAGDLNCSLEGQKGCKNEGLCIVGCVGRGW